MDLNSNFNTALAVAASKLSVTKQVTITSAASASGALAGSVVGAAAAAAVIASGGDIATAMAAAANAGATAGANAGMSSGLTENDWSFEDNAIADRGTPWPGAGVQELITTAGDPLNTPSSKANFPFAPQSLKPQTPKMIVN